MSETIRTDYSRVDKLTMQKRMQLVLQMKVANIPDKEIRKHAMQEYNYTPSQASRLLQKAMNNVKELTNKNIDQLAITVLAKEFQALKEVEDMGCGASQHDHRENIKLRLLVLDKIREITECDQYIQDRSEKKQGKIKLNEL